MTDVRIIVSIINSLETTSLVWIFEVAREHYSRSEFLRMNRRHMRHSI